MSMTRNRSVKSSPRCRKGTASVELAVCLPMLVAIFLAAIQAADIIFLKQTVCVAGYEATRAAIKRKSTNSSALAAGETVMNSRKVTNFNITFNPSDVSKVPRGQELAVTIEVPTSANTVLPSVLQLKKNLSVTTIMVKE